MGSCHHEQRRSVERPDPFYAMTRIMSDRVMMNVLSVLKSRSRTAGLVGVIIVASWSTDVDTSTNGNAGCMILSIGRSRTCGSRTSSSYRCVSLRDPDEPALLRDRHLREVVLTHQLDCV